MGSGVRLEKHKRPESSRDKTLPDRENKNSQSEKQNRAGRTPWCERPVGWAVTRTKKRTTAATDQRYITVSAKKNIRNFYVQNGRQVCLSSERGPRSQSRKEKGTVAMGDELSEQN